MRKAQKVEAETQQKQVIICPVPREKLADISLSQFVEEEGYQVPWSRFSESAWSLENLDTDKLIQKIRQVRTSLKDFIGTKPFYGIKTGFNEAFLIDSQTKNQIIQSEPKSHEIIKPYLRGQDIRRWNSNWQDLWMIFTRRGTDIDNYPAIKQHLLLYRDQLEPRPKDQSSAKNWKGRKAGSYQWFEIQDSVDYWQLLEQPKIIYQVIQFLPQFAFDVKGIYGNDKTYFLPTADLYLLGLLNSPLMWWHNWRYFGHMKDDALNPANFLMENLPIAEPTPEIRSQVEPLVQRLIEITQANQAGYRDVHDWLQSRFRIEKLGQKLETFATLSKQDLIEEVRNRIPKAGSKSSDRLGIAGMKEVTEVYNDYALPIQTRTIEAQKLEKQLSDLINQAYGLTPEEIDLMWKTAPPRMPIPNPSLG